MCRIGTGVKRGSGLCNDLRGARPASASRSLGLTIRSHAGLGSLTGCGGEHRQRRSLTAINVEIFRREPPLESSLDLRPFAIEDGETR